MWPGTLVANATMPGPPLAVYSVMNSVPPPTARLIAPRKPLLAPADVEVCSAMVLVSQLNSPASAITRSPGSSDISSTGIVVPMILCCICVSLSPLMITHGGTKLRQRRRRGRSPGHRVFTPARAGRARAGRNWRQRRAARRAGACARAGPYLLQLAVILFWLRDRSPDQCAIRLRIAADARVREALCSDLAPPE